MGQPRSAIAGSVSQGKGDGSSLTLGGLDDQIGAGSYASRQMSSDLVRPLQGDERSRCLGVLEKHLLWQYAKEAPYGPSDKAKIIGCLEEAEDRLSQPEERNKSWAEDDRAMIGSLKRNLARDFTEDDFTKSDQETRWFNDRDRSMYLNFEWLYSRLPKHSKVIVWAATVHVAKALSSVKGFEGRVPFGSYIRQDFGDRAFSLGFSAYSGDYEFIHPPVRQLSTAPAFSLEGQVFAHGNSDAVFLSRRQLRKYGSMAARPLGTSFKTALWDQLVDGLIVFRKERAPVWLSRDTVDLIHRPFVLVRTRFPGQAFARTITDAFGERHLLSNRGQSSCRWIVGFQTERVVPREIA